MRFPDAKRYPPRIKCGAGFRSKTPWLPPRLTHSIKRLGIEQAGRPAPVAAFQAFHAFHFPGYRTDPRPAPAGGLDRGAVAGRTVAARTFDVLSEPARRTPDRAGVWPGISGRHRSRPAAGVLARRHRVPRRGQSHVRRLSAGADLLGRDLRDPLSFRAHLRRW